jgi:chemotaxis protein histidine kinase CheA
MTSNTVPGQPAASGTGDDPAPGALPPPACKRPGCGSTLPPPGRGRARQFCSDECARAYHNHARLPAPSPGSGTDPLAALDALARQAAVLIRAARDQAAYLDPAHVRVLIAEADAGRRRAEAAAVTAQARAAEADAETRALAEALAAARDAQHAAEAAAARAPTAARDAAAEADAGRRDAREQITAARAQASEQITAARQDTARHASERDTALQAARDAAHHADTETSRARQAETDARAETARVRADAARERDTLRENHQARLTAASALTAAERARAERAERQLDTERAEHRHLTAPGNGQLPARKKTTATSDPVPKAGGQHA